LTFRKAQIAMTGFQDFIAWAGSQRQAAEALGLSDSTVSLIASGKRALLPQHVVRAEQVSGGLFRAEDLLPNTEFTRNEKGEVIGWQVKANKSE
jgi:DNA-binding transcriptional regulator YdaS (Cro superfamily)